ncbi:MAG: hypothetical protein BJ554DRAFT_2084 [Olpidium bornovanus]|uniref:BTB domain-containing protein n=1 Tax=Olpidium bornovanus TaxID=278681 RepID=A0A8H7ZQP4_9FUNG|nr:MAG: hypothetical protein BJ554DRAFT_2084 [Olpidium bornovanus]
MAAYSDPKQTTGDNLVGLWRPSLTRVGRKVYVFGGGGHVTTDLHALDLDTLRWSHVQVCGIPRPRPASLLPSPAPPIANRRNLTPPPSDPTPLVLTTFFPVLPPVGVDEGATSQQAIRPLCDALPKLDHNIRLVCDSVRRGSNEFQEYCNDVVIYDLSKRTWFRPNVGGKTVAARYLHSAVVHENKLYVYGGFARNTEMTYVLEELSVLDLESFVWSCVSTCVPARYNHTATVIKDKMYIYAGKDEQGNTVSDIFYVDLKTTKVVGFSGVSGEVVLLKSQHFAEAVNGNILVFGKYITPSTAAYLSDNQPHGLWLLDLEKLEWKRLEGSKDFAKGVWNYFTVLGNPRSSESDDGYHTPPATEIDGEVIRDSPCRDGAEDEVRLVFLGNVESDRHPPYDHFRDFVSVDIASLGVFTVPPSLLSSDLATLLDDPTLSDFTISARDGAPFWVHKTILMARWPHFRNVCGSGMIEASQGRMEIPEARGVVHAFLYYMYTDTIPRDAPWDVVADLLVLASLYFLPRLRMLCSHRLVRRHLTTETCARIFEKAVVAQEHGLKAEVLRYIFQNYGPVLKSQCMDTLPAHINDEFLACIPEDAALTCGETRPPKSQSVPAVTPTVKQQ